MKFQEMTWPQLKQVDREGTLVLAPVAACEQHGPHLPTFTDSLVADAIAEGVETELVDQVLLLPVLWLGASEHHLPFGATLTVRAETHIAMLTELARPLLVDGYRRLLFLNAHGGNTDTMHVALRRLQREHPDVLLTGAGFWQLAEHELSELCESPQTGPLHACEVETSMVLALRPELVQDAIRSDYHKQLPDKLNGLYLCEDMAQCTQDGIVGYPSYGTAAKGEKFLRASIDRVVEACRELLQTRLPLARNPKDG
jgi:creatinine amidohydrolase